MNQYWYTVTNYSLLFRLGFTFGDLHSVGVVKCIMTCSTHINKIIFSTLKKSPMLYQFIFSSPGPWQPLAYYCLHTFAFSKTSCSWNQKHVGFSHWLLFFFSHWLLLRSKIHSRFCDVFSRLHSSFFKKSLSDIQDGRTRVYLSIHLLKEVSIASMIFGLWNKASRIEPLWTPRCRSCGHEFAAPLGKYEGACYLNHTVKSMFGL